VEDQIRVSLSADSDGFVTQQCPSCTRRFKIRVNDDGTSSPQYCPYCGSGSEKGWLTEEQIAYVLGMGAEQVVDPLLEEFARELEASNDPGGLITRSARYEKSVPPPMPVESNVPMHIFTSPCCGAPVKHDETVSPLHCAACGKIDGAQESS
jgi:hypothetical protein